MSSPGPGLPQTNSLDGETVHAHDSAVQDSDFGFKEKKIVEVDVDVEATRTRKESSGDRNGNDEDKDEGEDDFPDGGLKAWMVVAGAALTTFGTFGFINSWGVFQSYYEQTILKDSSPSDIAWIGSVQYAMVFFPGLITGRLFDIGIFKIPYFIASACLIAVCFLTAECKEYWQFLLCQGFALGIACGTTFGPAISVIGHWFKRKRGLALGINAVGSSLGGTVLPIAVRRLIQEVGFKWTMRIIGFILTFVFTLSNMLLQRRLPPIDVSGGLFNLGAFREGAFSVYCFSCLVSFLGLYTVLTYIDISAVEIGISDDFSFYLVAITNAASMFGRIIAGVLTDKFGAINFIAPMTLIAGILTYAWPFARSQGSLIAVGIIYGFSSGAYVSTFLVPVYELGKVGDIGRRAGMVMSIGAIGALLGPPISGAIQGGGGGGDGGGNSFEGVGYYAGSMIVFSVVLMLITRHLVLKSVWGRF